MNNVITRNNVNVRGSGERTILFAHGFGCSQKTWAKVAPAFESNYQVVLFDYVGAGKSDLNAYHSKKYGSLEGYAKDVIEICDALHLTNVIFVGHSVSCMIGTLASIQRPSLFSNLIFLSPSPYFFQDGDYVGGLVKEDLDGLFGLMEHNYQGWSSLMTPLIMGNGNRPELAAELHNSFCSTDPRIAREFARVTFFSDNRRQLPELSVPSLSLQCQEDMLAPFHVGNYILEHTPFNSLKNLQATGHCPHLSAPDEVISVLQHYLIDHEDYHPHTFVGQ